jgi:hypothetical protein
MFLRGFTTLLGLQNYHKSFIWGRENLDRHFKVLVEKRLHEVMELSRNRHNDLFILVKTFLMVMLLQNAVTKPQTIFPLTSF